MLQIKNYIGGKFQSSANKAWIDNYAPANGKIYSQIADSDKDDIEQAVKAAQFAFPFWSSQTPEYRCEQMLRIAELIDQNLEEFALAESKDNGKPLSLARSVDIPRAVYNFRFFAHAITQFASESHDSIGEKSINFTLRRPLGVVGCISPWNLPLYLLTWKIAPALAAGNCVVAKPSEVTPYSAFLLAEILDKAGFIKGVLNIVHGKGATAGQAIVEHPEIKAISFTGGTQTGAHIAKIGAPMFKKLSLELGGKNPNIIFADCDYEKMLHTTLRSSFSNQGQICLCGSRIFVERSIYKRFTVDFVTKAKALKVGDPAHPETLIGALVSETHRDKVESYISFAKAHPKEYKILCGGERVYIPGLENGYYLSPAVIEVSSNSCRLNQEEIFGPVVTLMPFDDESEAIELANGVVYGLSATLWTSEVSRVMRISEKLESGVIWVNTWMMRDLRTPFGGMKNSGVGREGGFEALRFFTEPKNVCIQY